MSKIKQLELDKLSEVALSPQGAQASNNYLIKLNGLTICRDSLTKLQQKILTEVISLCYKTKKINPEHTVHEIELSDFLKMCEQKAQDLNVYSFLINELNKLIKKGLWIYDEQAGNLVRTQWFQAIEYANEKIIFQFTENFTAVMAAIKPDDIEYKLVRGIQYKGKHTFAVFKIIWAERHSGVAEYTIQELMKGLSLEYTRYSYGQLRLRVLEPSLKEIYDWDEAIFVRFGPTFSGRRVEGVWFEVTTGEEAKELRKKEPEFKFSDPEQKPCN